MRQRAAAEPERYTDIEAVFLSASFVRTGIVTLRDAPRAIRFRNVTVSTIAGSARVLSKLWLGHGAAVGSEMLRSALANSAVSRRARLVVGFASGAPSEIGRESQRSLAVERPFGVPSDASGVV
jgi:hypothetical protein